MLTAMWNGTKFTAKVFAAIVLINVLTLVSCVVAISIAR